MIDLLIVLDYYRLLSEKAFSVRYYWVIQSWHYAVLSWIDKILNVWQEQIALCFDFLA